MSLYSCHEIPGSGFAMCKLDMDFNPEATYSVTNATCSCPAGVRPTCKHRSRLLPAFMNRNHIGDGWFLNDVNMMWHRPISLDSPTGVEMLQQCNEVLDLVTEAQAHSSGVPTDFKRRV